MQSFRYVASNRIRFHQRLHLRKRQIDHYRFLHIDSGRGKFRFADRHLEVQAGSLLLLSPGQRESIYGPDEPVSYLYVEFESVTELFGEPFIQCATSSVHFDTLRTLIASLHHQRGGGLKHLLPAAVELALLPSDEFGDDEKLDPRIRRTLQYIERHIDRPLRVAQLAAEAGLSLPHFRRLFQHGTGTSPKEYLLRERMQHARRILQTEGLRVGEVAEVLHFENVFQFSNQYKRVFGHSPAEDKA